MSFLNTHTGFRGLSGEDLGGSGFKDVEGKGEGEGDEPDKAAKAAASTAEKKMS